MVAQSGKSSGRDAPQDLRDEWLEIAEQIVNGDYDGWEDVEWEG